MSWTLDVGQRRHEIVDGEQLREQLLVAHRQASREPIIALLNAPDGSTLAVGLGSHRSVLNYIAPGGWPSRHTVDDAAGVGLVRFTLAGQISEVPLRGTVEIEDAIDACVSFMATGKIDEMLKWDCD
jgi:hypothetical protein